MAGYRQLRGKGIEDIDMKTFKFKEFTAKPKVPMKDKIPIKEIPTKEEWLETKNTCMT